MAQDEKKIVANRKMVRRGSRIEEFVLILLILLSLVGVVISDYSPSEGYRYWMLMIVIFGFISVFLGIVESKKQTGSLVKDILVVQVIHWLGAMLTVIAVFLLLQAEKLNSESTGMVILLILALATFIDGIRLGWRFCMAGIFLGTTSVISAFFQDFVTIVIFLALIIISFTLYWEKRALRRA